MRSNSSARTSLLAATSFATYTTMNVRKIRGQEIDGILAEMKTPTPAKIMSAGENTWKIYISGSLKCYINSSVETYETEAAGDDGRKRA